MTIKKRNELKMAFKKGSIPTQEDFSNLIDSFIHKEEDGLFGAEGGLKMVPLGSSGSSKKFASFLKNVTNKTAVWSLEPHPNNSEEFGLNFVDLNGVSQFLISSNGYVGLGTLSPQTKLDVNGNMQSFGRRGNYKSGKVLGNGKWHKIIEHLTDCHLFEIVAKINKPGCGMHSIIHATAANAFNGEKKDINITRAYYGSFRNRIELRWTGDTFDYNLEIRTRRDYEDNSYIEYYITNLWF